MVVAYIWTAILKKRELCSVPLHLKLIDYSDEWPFKVSINAHELRRSSKSSNCSKKSNNSEPEGYDNDNNANDDYKDDTATRTLPAEPAQSIFKLPHVPTLPLPVPSGKRSIEEASEPAELPPLKRFAPFLDQPVVSIKQIKVYEFGVESSITHGKPNGYGNTYYTQKTDTKLFLNKEEAIAALFKQVPEGKEDEVKTEDGVVTFRDEMQFAEDNSL